MDAPISAIQKYIRAANYLTVTQIYLRDNFLLKQPLSAKDIKQRLFGHWGTCPGINFVYAHLQYTVKKYDQSTIFVLGPGHGFPALQANLFLEGTLSKYFKDATLDEKGIAYVSKMFSWPYGFSSHSNPEAPGLILEGGELGYSLATAYGAVLDNPDLLAVCMIGDGEAETGPISSAWHLNKLIDPSINGAVLPVLHVNGYKISGPTIFGRMSDDELTELFRGYGYEPFFVKAQDSIDEVMQKTLDTCIDRIKHIKKEWKSGKSFKPRFPMIILQTPKGWTGVKELKNKKVEGNIAAHQVVAPNARKDEVELSAIDLWLRSYKFEELFDEKNGFDKDMLSILPKESLRIGNNPHVFSQKIYKPLVLPDPKKLEKEMQAPGKLTSQSMKNAGSYLKEVFVLNEPEKNFRVMSPDETYSNRLDAIFDVTSRAFVWPYTADDKHMSHDGRVMEMLAEHNLHGLAQGYILSGRHAVFATYEAFAQIFSSMTHQYEKFLKVFRSLSWRGDVASLNIMLSSVLWRQEHNGFTHQNPSFTSGMLEKHDCKIAAYYPVDDNSMVAILDEVLRSKAGINIIIAGKSVEPRWQTMTQALKQVQDGGIATWDFASDKNPDVVVVGIGDYMVRESLAAIEMLKMAAPDLRLRFVNVQKLSGRCECADTYHPQLPHFESYVTDEKPVIVNFHGYPETFENMLLRIKNPGRFSVHGYKEFGGTTTPFDMLVRNHTDRYHIAIDMLEKAKETKAIDEKTAKKLIDRYNEALEQHHDYVITYGVDPVELEEWHFDTVEKINDDAIQLTVLKKSKTVGMVGLSKDPDAYSHKVGLFLQEKGYRVIPINPTLSEVLGEKAYATVSDLPNEIKLDLVAIYRRSEDVFPHMEEIVKKTDVKTVWLPEGVRNKEAESLAETHGITVVSDFCIMKEHQRLQHTR